MRKIKVVVGSKTEYYLTEEEVDVVDTFGYEGHEAYIVRRKDSKGFYIVLYGHAIFRNLDTKKQSVTNMRGVVIQEYSGNYAITSPPLHTIKSFVRDLLAGNIDMTGKHPTLAKQRYLGILAVEQPKTTKRRIKNGTPINVTRVRTTKDATR